MKSLLLASHQLLWRNLYFCHLLLLCSGQVMFDSWATQQTVALQALLSMGLSRQEYWSGYHFLLQGIILIQGLLPFPPLRNLPDPGIEPMSLALAGRFFTTEPPGKPTSILNQDHLPLFRFKPCFISSVFFLLNSLLVHTFTESMV